MLSTLPRPRSLHYPCLRCQKDLYDGGLGKCVICACGLAQFRKDDDTVSPTQAPDLGQFSTLFRICNNRLPANTELFELRSLTLGVFLEGVAPSLQGEGEINYAKVLTECVVPFFSQVLRCVGLNDYFETPGASFKVVGCQPNFGVIGKNTQLIVGQTLSSEPLERMHVLPMQPHVLSDEFVRSSLLPYLRSGPVHLHTGQILYVREVVCVVVAATPDDGLVTPATQVFTQGDPLTSLTELHLTASLQSIPPVLRSLSRIHMIWAMLHLYIAPHYRGRYRSALQGYRMLLEGVVFRVNRCWPHFGVVTEYTRLTCDISITNSQVIRMINPNTGQIVSMLVMPGAAPVPKGVSADVLASFPERQLCSVPSGDDNQQCMVCLEDFEVGSTVKTLPCCKS